MNRELIFRGLQVAVVAPYIYTVAKHQDSDYFRIGLRLVAGSIIILNARPLFEAVKPTLQRALDFYIEQNGFEQKNKPREAIDAEYTEVNK